MKKVLVSWIGAADLRAPNESSAGKIGPIARALLGREFQRVVLLHNSAQEEVDDFLKWLRGQVVVQAEQHPQELDFPMHFGQIYKAAVGVVEKLQAEGEHALTFHLSPGTSAMAAVWIILAKTRYPAELIEALHSGEIRTTSVPFDISAEFIPDILRRPDRQIERLSRAEPPEAPGFEQIIFRSELMGRLVRLAQRVALHSVPVLLEGESGTGKELFARAIHNAGPRRKGAFIPVNCGALPPELVESVLFGHERGAFTGADKRQIGVFEAAQGGTLFLDEIGELPKDAQVKLLRVLQEKEVSRVGSTERMRLDVRIIAATNRNLVEEVSKGRFREDLFYRLAVAVLHLPPLREREGDLNVLLRHLLERINLEFKELGLGEKSLTPGAINVALGYHWPGNIRELLNSLQRAAIWSETQEIQEREMREALLPAFEREVDLLAHPLGDGFSLEELLSSVARSYLERAFLEAGEIKTRAAKLLGLRNHQNFTSWVKRHGAKAPPK